MWRAQIKAKYGTVEELAAAWDEASISFDDLYLPPKTEASRSRKATTARRMSPTSGNHRANRWQSTKKRMNR